MVAEPVPLPAARIARLARAYLDAEYRWELDGCWRELPVGHPAPAPEEAFPDARRFALLTAWNPQSLERDDAINRAADDGLLATLEASGLRHRPAFASARNRSWREPSWLVVDMAEPTLDALARRLGQLGTLHWRRGGPVGLRMYAARPPGIAVDGRVAWLGTSPRQA